MNLLLDSPMAADPQDRADTGDPDGRILVLGIGNVLMGDEGAGVHVLRALERQDLPTGVRLLDGGTGGVVLLGDLERARSVILVDATRDGSKAGTLGYRYRRQGGFGRLPPELGAHDFGLKDLFAAATLLRFLPEVHLYTIAVETIRPMTTELSPAVAAAAGRVADSVQALARRLAAA